MDRRVLAGSGVVTNKHATVATNKERVDVSWDRPEHWKSSTAALRSKKRPTTTAAPPTAHRPASSLSSTGGGALKRAKTTGRAVHNPGQLVTGLNMGAALGVGAVRSLQGLSFAPSWMTSSSHHSTANTSRADLQRPTGFALSRSGDNSVLESDDILDDMGACHSPPARMQARAVTSTHRDPDYGGADFSGYSQQIFSPGASVPSSAPPGSGGRRHSGAKVRPSLDSL